MYRRQIDPELQMTLPILPPIVPIRRKPRMTISEQFEAFHAANPHVMDILRAMALDLAHKGYKHFGLKMLWEVLRYQYAIGTVQGDDPYRFNNNLTSRYAHKLVELEPSLRELIELRELKAK